MPIRCALIDADLLAADPPEADTLAVIGSRCVVGVVHPTGPASAAASPGAAAFELPLNAMGLAADDPTVLVVAAAAARCFPRELVLVTRPGASLITAAEAAGTRVITGDGPDVLEHLDHHLDALEDEESGARAEVGVGPHRAPWPTGPEFDPTLLADGDRRNVVDRYRYWSEAAIVADLDRHRRAVHVAVENWQHDLNIGTVVRNANAFNVAGVHIIGKRRWNRRGAMATDRYLHLRHHATIDEFAHWAAGEELAVIGIDNVPGSVPLSDDVLPREAVLLLGQEGPGLSAAALAICQMVCEIAQFGSTRSLNAGVASGIAMHVWTSVHGQMEDGA
jgi:tRNA(Leu) C34 or U34 (ribose-2'-O)-methylase TrmL